MPPRTELRRRSRRSNRAESFGARLASVPTCGDRAGSTPRGTGRLDLRAAGSYAPAFVSAACLAFLAAGLTLAIREKPLAPTPTGAPVLAPASS
jgi:hypothetical protein